MHVPVFARYSIIYSRRGWETLVRDVLGKNFYFNDTRRSSCATLQDLATHTMGIPPHEFLRMRKNFNLQLLERYLIQHSIYDFNFIPLNIPFL